MAAPTKNEITSLLERSTCYCLNENPRAAHVNLFQGDKTLALRSDADEQLLLHLSFNQTVKVVSLELGLPGDQSCPATLKVYVNAGPHMGFADANEKPATQVFRIDDMTQEKLQMNLKAMNFSRVESITIFVEDNHGSPFSSLHSLHVFGQPVQGTDVSKISGG